MTCQTDRALKLVRASPAFLRAFPAALLGGPLLDALSAIPSFPGSLLDDALAGADVGFDGTLPEASGRIREVAITCSPLVTASGAVDGLGLAFFPRRYVSERACFTLDSDWCFMDVNPAGEAALRANREELTGKMFWSEFPQAVGSVFETEFRRAKATGEDIHFEEFCASLNAWLEVWAHPTHRGLEVQMHDVTQRRAAALETARLLQQLDHERALFKTLFESLTVGVLYMDAETGRVTMGNPEALRIVGFSVEDLESRRPNWVGFHPDGARLSDDEWPILRGLRGETVAARDILFQRGDGQLVWLSAGCAPVRDRSGRVLGSVAVFSNVHRERQASEELQRKERELATLLDNIPDVVARFNRDLRYLLVSQSVETHSGISPAVLIGRTHAELGLPASGFDAAVARVFQTASTEMLEFSYAGPLGKRSYFTIVAPETDSQGAVGSVLTITRDISDYKAAAESLAFQERRLAMAIEVARLGTWELDLKTFELTCSARTKAMYGFSPDAELTLQDFARVFSAADWDRWQGEARKAVANRSDYRGEQRFVLPDGSVRWTSWSGRVIDNELGPGRMLGVTLDVTEQKMAEEELTRQTDELMRSNADLQQFAYVISHDLQEPLRTVTSFAQMVEKRYRGRLDEEADQFLGFIVSGALRMKSLIDSLLDYSRVGIRNAPRFVPVGLDAAFGRAVENLRSVIEESGAEFIKGPLPEVMGEPAYLPQLFQNLLANAVKYRRPRIAPRISVSAERQGDDWVLSVRDNGIGIAADHRDLIFGVFRRLHGREIPGTGIGLAIAKRIVERHGGRIWVESAPGEGSTFLFTLPAMK